MEQFEETSYGTPGNRNTPCLGDDGICEENGVWRDVVSPQIGDLAITEYLARPSQAASPQGEWLEVVVLRDIDLNGLELGRAEPSGEVGAIRRELSSPQCLFHPAGARVLFAGSMDEADNGAMAGVDYPLGFGVVDADDGLFVGYAGSVLDVVTYTDRRGRGAAMQLKEVGLLHEENDREENWCEAEVIYGLGDRGTPGQPNPDCPTRPNANECWQDGEVREIVRPTLGQLVISEYFARPKGIPASSGEWLELEIRGSFDLNGLQLGRAERDTIDFHPLMELQSVDCLAVQSGEFIPLVRSADTSLNGGIDSPWGVLAFGLVDRDDGVFVAADGVVLDSAFWTERELAGRSRQRQEDGFCVTAQDDTLEYYPGNFGTPGKAGRCE